MKIPFSPPDITEAEANEVRDALLSGWITTGPRTKELERQIARQKEEAKAQKENETRIIICKSPREKREKIKKINIENINNLHMYNI